MMSKPNTITLFSALALMLLAGNGCLHQDPDTSAGSDMVRPLTDSSDLSGIEMKKLPGYLQIPEELLSMKKVIRPATPLRGGPGTMFPIKDKLLSWGDRVIETGAYLVWRKILVLPGFASGWVHSRALGPAEQGEGNIQVPGHSLPVRHTKKQISEIFSYPELKKVPAEIPANTPYLLIRSEESRSLLWIPETGSVAWFEKNQLY